MSLRKLAFPPDAHERIIRDIGAAGQIRIGGQMQRCVVAHDDAADEISAARDNNRATARNLARVEGCLKRYGVLVRAVPGRAESAHVKPRLVRHRRDATKLRHNKKQGERKGMEEFHLENCA